MKIIKIVFLLVFLFVLSLSFIHIPLNAEIVQAQSLWDKQTGKAEIAKAFNENGDPKDVRIVVVRIIKVFLTFLGLIFTGIILWAGFNWMTSSGQEDKINSAKNQIKAGIIGFIIIITSYLIVDYTANCVLDILNESGTWMCKQYNP